MPIRSLSEKKIVVLYLTFTFLITYTCWIILALRPDIVFGTPLFMVLYMIGGFGPTISAFLITIFDRKYSRDFYKRLIKWRLSPAIYIFTLVVVVSMCVSLFFILGSNKFSIKTWYMIFPYFLMMIIGGGLEELGWRGILLESLIKSKWNIYFSSIFIGIIWAFWHFPLFHINGVSQYQGDFFLFFINVIGLSIVTTVLYTVSRSTLICIIFHALVNTTYSMGFDVLKNDRIGLIIKNLIPIIIAIIMVIGYEIKKKKFDITIASS